VYKKSVQCVLPSFYSRCQIRFTFNGIHIAETAIIFFLYNKYYNTNRYAFPEENHLLVLQTKAMLLSS